MTDRIRHEIRMDLHATSFGEGIACDYHARPETLPTDEPVLIEAIRLVDHPQLDEYPDHWVIDTARCADHAVDEIVEPTRGFEEVLLRVPVMTSNDIVSISTPEVDDVSIRAFSPANEGLHPMVIDQTLLDAADPKDVGFSRWTRVIGMVAAEPPEPLREHLEALIEQSPETPEMG